MKLDFQLSNSSNDIMLRFTFDDIRIQPTLGNSAVKLNVDQTSSPIVHHQTGRR